MTSGRLGAVVGRPQLHTSPQHVYRSWRTRLSAGRYRSISRASVVLISARSVHPITCTHRALLRFHSSRMWLASRENMLLVAPT